MSSVLRGSGFRSAVARPMVGDTKTSMVRVDHLGWLVCDGRSLLKSEYRALYAVLGDSFGSVDADHFNLPDAEGRVVGLIGQAITDSSSNVWVDGDMSGEETHTLVIAEMPSHRHGSVDVSGSAGSDGLTGVSGEHIHGINDPGHTHSLPLQSEGFADIGPDDDVTQGSGYNTGSSTTGITINAAGAHQHTIGRTGGDQPHNNLQPTIFMGNLFVFGGRVVHNVTDVDGVSVPVANVSYYPPSTPANRLY